MALLRRVAAWSLRMRGPPNGFGGGNIMVPVPDSVEMRDKPCAEKFVVATTTSCCVVVAAHDGGPQRFWGRQHNGAGTGFDRDRRHLTAEKFVVATTAPCCIVIAAHEGGPQRFVGNNINGGVSDAIVIGDNPPTQKSAMPLLRSVQRDATHQGVASTKQRCYVIIEGHTL